PSVRDAAAAALESMGAAAARDDVLTALVQRLQDDDADARHASVWALGSMGSSAARGDVLTAPVQCLQHDHRYVRRAAAEALGTMQSGPQGWRFWGMLPLDGEKGPVAIRK